MSTPTAEEMARNWTESKEQATAREWSAYGDVRMEAYLAGYRARDAEVEGLKEELSRFSIWGTDACPGCEAGRITLFVKSGRCAECHGGAKS